MTYNIKGGIVIMTTTLKQYEEIGKLIREIKSNDRCIRRYTKENEEFIKKLSDLIGRPITLEEVLADDDNDELF